jgi:hypothetical protein
MVKLSQAINGNKVFRFALSTTKTVFELPWTPFRNPQGFYPSPNNQVAYKVDHQFQIPKAQISNHACFKLLTIIPIRTLPNLSQTSSSCLSSPTLYKFSLLPTKPRLFHPKPQCIKALRPLLLLHGSTSLVRQNRQCNLFRKRQRPQ